MNLIINDFNVFLDRFPRQVVSCAADNSMCLPSHRHLIKNNRFKSSKYYHKTIKWSVFLRSVTCRFVAFAKSLVPTSRAQRWRRVRVCCKARCRSGRSWNGTTARIFLERRLVLRIVNAIKSRHSLSFTFDVVNSCNRHRAGTRTLWSALVSDLQVRDCFLCRYVARTRTVWLAARSCWLRKLTLISSTSTWAAQLTSSIKTYDA